MVAGTVGRMPKSTSCCLVLVGKEDYSQQNHQIIVTCYCHWKNECCSDNDNNNTYNNNIHCHNHLVGAITTRRMRAAVTMMLTKAYTQRTNVLTEEPG